MDLGSDSFIKTFLIRYFGYLINKSKINWVSTSLSRELYGISIRHGLTLFPMKNYQVFLQIF